MMELPSDRGHRRRAALTSVFAALFACVGASGCMTYQRQGDRAFEQGDCDQALYAYEHAIDNDSKDPELYYRAAKCSMRLGDFASAESYFGKSLRFGAGLDVARELASFYVKTSNYVSAVRVYQYLLYEVSDKQPVYNNLGTALMYAGQYFDAESYLMVAQQLEPEDPLPYVNLAVLYDRHLRQPWLAINFYDCYQRLSPRAPNVDAVAQRSKELRSRYSRMYQEEILECGQAYEPRADSAPTGGLKKAIELEMDAQTPTDETPGEGEASWGMPGSGKSDAPDAGGGDASDQPTEIPIDRVVTEQVASPDRAKQSQLDRGRRAYEQGEWSEVVDALTRVPVANLSGQEQKMLGLAYLQQSNWTLSAHWLGLAVLEAEDTEVVGGLFTAFGRMKRDARVAELCKEFGKRPKYEKLAREHCTVDESTE